MTKVHKQSSTTDISRESLDDHSMKYDIGQVLHKSDRSFFKQIFELLKHCIYYIVFIKGVVPFGISNSLTAQKTAAHVDAVCNAFFMYALKKHTKKSVW